jgi:hypothetical protein
MSCEGNILSVTVSTLFISHLLVVTNTTCLHIKLSGLHSIIIKIYEPQTPSYVDLPYFVNDISNALISEYLRENPIKINIHYVVKLLINYINHSSSLLQIRNGRHQKKTFYLFYPPLHLTRNTVKHPLHPSAKIPALASQIIKSNWLSRITFLPPSLPEPIPIVHVLVLDLLCNHPRRNVLHPKHWWNANRSWFASTPNVQLHTKTNGTPGNIKAWINNYFPHSRNNYPIASSNITYSNKMLPIPHLILLICQIEANQTSTLISTGTHHQINEGSVWYDNNLPLQLLLQFPHHFLLCDIHPQHHHSQVLMALQLLMMAQLGTTIGTSTLWDMLNNTPSNGLRRHTLQPPRTLFLQQYLIASQSVLLIQVQYKFGHRGSEVLFHQLQFIFQTSFSKILITTVLPPLCIWILPSTFLSSSSPLKYQLYHTFGVWITDKSCPTYSTWLH